MKIYSILNFQNSNPNVHHPVTHKTQGTLISSVLFVHSSMFTLWNHTSNVGSTCTIRSHNVPQYLCTSSGCMMSCSFGRVLWLHDSNYHSVGRFLERQGIPTKVIELFPFMIQTIVGLCLSMLLIRESPSDIQTLQNLVMQIYSNCTVHINTYYFKSPRCIQHQIACQ